MTAGMDLWSEGFDTMEVPRSPKERSVRFIEACRDAAGGSEFKFMAGKMDEADGGDPAVVIDIGGKLCALKATEARHIANFLESFPLPAPQVVPGIIRGLRVAADVAEKEFGVPQ